MTARNFWTLGGLTVAAILLAYPMLANGPMPTGHDTYEHLNYTRHFAEQFWGGEMFPHWLLNMNHGLGSPSFFVYPPLPSYLNALLLPVGVTFHFNAFKATAFLALLASGIFAFLWISTMASRGTALIAAITYMLLPYHLAIDFYRRTALSECWALAWMPLILYFCVKVMQGQRRAIVGLAVAYALMILSHVVSVFMFSLIPLLMAGLPSAKGQRVKACLMIAGGMALGTGLSCFYFLPALYHSRYFPVSRLFISVKDNLLHLGRGLAQSQGFIRIVSVTVLETILIIAFCAFMGYRGALPDQKRQIVFWTTICVVPVLLMSRLSAGIWQKLPFLSNAVQYPWRLNIVLCIAVLPIVAIFLSQVSWPPTLFRSASLAIAALVVGTWIVSYESVWKDYSLKRTAFPTDPVNESDGWYLAWKAPGVDYQSPLRASHEAQVRFTSGTGSAEVLLWQARHVEFETDTQSGGVVMVNQFYYPEWRVSVINETTDPQLSAAVPEGLLAVQVPAGQRRIRLDIPISKAERVGKWLSLVCCVLCMILYWKPGPLNLLANTGASQ